MTDIDISHVTTEDTPVRVLIEDGAIVMVSPPARGFEEGPMTHIEITLAALPPGATVQLDGTPTGATVAVPTGRHRITLAATGSWQASEA